MSKSLRGMRLGVATAATQIEGGGFTDTLWYDWYRAGRVEDGTSPEVADDHWVRWREDADLLASLGVRDYRLGLEWGRIETAPGVFDDAALAHYRAEIEYLQSLGIRVLVTLHHFSTPRWLDAVGGFLTARGPAAFLRFTRHVVESLGDLVDEWITINEPNVYATAAYFFDQFPPGGKPSLRRVIRAYRQLAVAHTRAYDLIHELQPHALVGVANHLRVFAPLDAASPRHRAMARLTRFLFQDAITDAFCTGSWAFALLPAPQLRKGRYYDFLGLNYYTRSAITGLDDGVFPGVPTTDSGWEIYPAGIAELATWLTTRYPDAPLYITENGTCDLDDRFRPKYLWDHLEALVDSGVAVERYYHWTFIDNWEWDRGERQRFGLVHNDFRTQERTLRESARMYTELIDSGSLTDDIYQRYVAGKEYPVHDAPDADAERAAN